MRRLTKVFKTLASGAMASAAALALVLPSAAALPPGGAEGSTEGTSSTVTGSVEAGGTLSFTLSGFPAGETVSIKIDDGALDGSDNSVSGTGVVHQQKIGANGSVSGSFVLPSYVKPGTHWLRFLASQDIPESQGGGTKGFTNRSPQFTVTSLASDSGEQGGAGGAAGSNEAAGSGAGGSVAGGNGTGAGAAGGGAGSAGAAGGAPGAGTNSGVGAGSQAAPSAGASAKATSGTLKVTASPNAKKKSQPAATTVTTIVAVGQSSKPAFPVLGVSVFAAAVLIGAAAIGAVLLRNRRQAGAAGAAGAAAAGGGAANSAGAGAAGAGAGKSAGASAGAGASGVGNFPGPAA